MVVDMTIAFDSDSLSERQGTIEIIFSEISGADFIKYAEKPQRADRVGLTPYQLFLSLTH